MFSFQGASLSFFFKRLNEDSSSHLDLQSISYETKWWAKMDSLFCGKATPVATVHRTVAKSRLSSPFYVSRIQLFAFHFDLLLKWWAKMDSNHRPHDYQSCALASWAIGPYLVEISGIEPLTSCLQGRRSPSWAKPPYLHHSYLGT